MKRSILGFSLIAIALAAAVLAACAPTGGKEVVVGLNAGFSGAAARAVNAGDIVTTIDAYRVAFKKVEIGNSEEDKFTLWESADGEILDVAAPVEFQGVLPVSEGTYEFVRLTIGPELSVDGSIDDAGTVYSGTGSVILDKTVYVWGSGLAGASSLGAPITVTEGCELSFSFDVAGTVAYRGGPAADAELSVTKPELSVTVE